MENTPSFAVTEGPLVTLVVPMYNVAPYLERCLRSLEKQTYRNIEVIIMDDCSTDGSLDIAGEMAASDMRFKVFSMPRNSGAGDARQAAIEKSSGEFIGFVDADDYVDMDFVAVLYGLITKTGADVACCQHYFYDEEHQRLTTPWAYDDKVVCLSPDEAMRKMKGYDQMDEGLWNKLCRREIVVRHRRRLFPSRMLLYYTNTFRRRRAWLCVVSRCIITTNETGRSCTLVIRLIRLLHDISWKY